MPAAASSTSPAPTARLRHGPVAVGAEGARGRAETVLELQSRISSMQTTKLATRGIPTHPAIAGLLPGGALQQGSAYSVVGSTTLLMALLAAPSAAGTWCAVVGVPEFGVEAAARFGIDLERLVLVPDPGDQWLAVAAAIADVMGVVALRPPKRASDGAVSRLSARLRQRGSTLVVLGNWPQSDAILTLSQSDWSGIGDGHGYLEARQATVTVTSSTGGRPRSARLWLPDEAEQFRAVTAGVHGVPVRGAERYGTERRETARHETTRHETTQREAATA